jgi:hypothetical protein
MSSPEQCDGPINGQAVGQFQSIGSVEIARYLGLGTIGRCYTAVFLPGKGLLSLFRREGYPFVLEGSDCRVDYPSQGGLWVAGVKAVCVGVRQLLPLDSGGSDADRAHTRTALWRPWRSGGRQTAVSSGQQPRLQRTGPSKVGSGALPPLMDLAVRRGACTGASR